MAFHFSLDSLLRLRRSVEHQHEIALADAIRNVAQQQQKIAQLEDSLRQMMEQEEKQLASGAHAIGLQTALYIRSRGVENLRELHNDLMHLKKIESACRAALLRARQEREILETLRERQLSQYHQDEARREQRRVDDLFLLRREYRQRQ